jgi:hypothetical protein
LSLDTPKRDEHLIIGVNASQLEMTSLRPFWKVICRKNRSASTGNRRSSFFFPSWLSRIRSNSQRNVYFIEAKRNEPNRREKCSVANFRPFRSVSVLFHSCYYAMNVKKSYISLNF